MTGTGVSRKEACLLRESLASPKSITKIVFPALYPPRVMAIRKSRNAVYSYH